jgi:hypothetical protein
MITVYRTDNELTLQILREIEILLMSRVMPVSVDHLGHLCRPGEILQYLMRLKSEGLISGDLITIGAGGTPHRITNIRLTYTGIKALGARKDPPASNTEEWADGRDTGKND